MDYEPHRVEYVAGNAYVGATLSMFPNAYVGATLSMFPADRVKDDGDGFKDNMGNFIAWDAGTGKIVWSKPELFSVWSGVLTTAGGIAVYGTLDGWVRVVDQKDGKTLWEHKTPSGIIGNVSTWMSGGKQQIGVPSGVGGWAGIGLAASVPWAAMPICRSTRSSAARSTSSSSGNR
jgi:glucose dehydrogenase